jgi:hypothetical protein
MTTLPWLYRCSACAAIVEPDDWRSHLRMHWLAGIADPIDFVQEDRP